MEDNITNAENAPENNSNTARELNKEEQKPKSSIKEEELKAEIKAFGSVHSSNLININQSNPEDFQNLMLNIRITNFLKLLGEYNTLVILCYKAKCAVGFRTLRNYQVYGINHIGEENLIMTASQEELHHNSSGYMLVYKSNNAIFASLGYQINPLDDCQCFGDCFIRCCKSLKKNFCSGCKLDNCCCESCYQNDGGCFKGGCCTEQACCCCWENECQDGCCNCCNCCCCEGGCCKEPCCVNGCCPCPNYEKILLDVRLLNTMKEALIQQAGLYVTTLYSPFDCFGLNPTHIGYKKCGERFILENKCCACSNETYSIIDSEKKEQVGFVKQKKTCSFDVKSFEVKLPKNAFPLEKLLIISEIFMMSYLKWDEGRNDRMIVTKKRKKFPGLDAKFN